MAEIEKTKRFIRYLICLFAAATVLILTGGAKMAFGNHGLREESAKVQAAAQLYVPSGENPRELAALAEHSPEFLLYAAGNSSLRSIKGIAE